MFEQDCRFIREYLKKMRIASEVFTIDLTEEKEYGKLKNMKADICLIFKTLDQLERVKRNISEKLLKAVDAEIIVVSFPTVSISGKNIIDVSKRGWFEKLLDRLGWKFEKFNISNELFYVFKRS
jgi:transcriptional/translational regulatory protein YebC/TACO1